ncbi:MAG: ribonuclease P protein component [Lysobacteraceae bacterium]
MTSAAFTRQARLLTPADFQRVFAKGRRFNSPHLQLIARPRDPVVNATDVDSETRHVAEPSPARLGLTVAKRVAKRAVDRNRVKRIARDSFRRHQHRLTGLDLVLVARGGIAELPGNALHEALETLWQRAQTLKPTPSPVKLAPPDAGGIIDSASVSPVTSAKRDPSP